MSANQKPQGQTQRLSPVRSSAWFGIPMFITQESPALALGKNTAAISRSLCRECNRKTCKRKPASIGVIRGQNPGGPPHLTSRSCPWCMLAAEHLIRLTISRLQRRLWTKYACFLDCRSNTSLETRLNIERAKAASFPSPGVVPNPKARLLDQVREVVRVKHYSIRTEEAYVQWIKR